MQGWTPRFMVGLTFWCLSATPRAAMALNTAASVASELRQLSIDPNQTFRVRELEIARGDIKIYLTEGILAFAKPVAGKTIAAVFTTGHTEAGEAEVLVLPTSRSERAALASFIKTPNLDEHIHSAVFFFTDETADELKTQMADRPLHPAPEEAKELAADNVLRADSNEIDVKLTRALLDNHPPARGFFYGIVAGRSLGVFNVVYEPDHSEPVIVGRVMPLDDGGQFFQIWCSFRPRRAVAASNPTRRISEYRLDTVLHQDLSMSSQAKFRYRADHTDGRAIEFELSSHLRVTSAAIDGKPAEVFQHEVAGQLRIRGASSFLLVAAVPLAIDVDHEVDVSYEGSVVRRTASGNYFVDERNTWYPFTLPMLSIFDLTFRCPETLRVVSSGELISDDVSSGVRTVHRRTQVPEPLAGFNIGDYESSSTEHGGYRIELFTNKLKSSAGLPAQAAGVLDYYTERWQPLPIHSLAISPIEGYFGQGFPGLVYLSSISYLRQEDRPADLRNPQLDSFFTEMLLPHEIAHQWWGSMVSQVDYRSAWLFEAMSNYAALEFLERNKGRPALDAVIEGYRQDLLSVDKGATIESAGPVDFGERLLENNGMRAWHVVVYEKGVWILHMLRMRLGDEPFHTLQTRLIDEFKNTLISNDDFRKLAATLMPEDQSDKTLNLFFDNWVYSTGIPTMKFRSTANSVSLKVSAVDETFTFDLPLRCKDANGKEEVAWVHAGTGENAYEMPAGSHCQLPRQADFLFQLAK
jgi:Peptidase family M1 domain